MTPARHHVEYFEVENLDVDEPPLEGFDLVAISTFTAQVQQAYELADRVQARGMPVVIGGLHITSVPGEASDRGVSAAVGEGEVIWPEILRDAERGRLQPVYDARGGSSSSPTPRCPRSSFWTSTGTTG